MTEAEVKQAMENARAQLDQGKEESAAIDLQRVLAGVAASHPQHKVAASFMRQMREDPQQLYGRDSFPYRVQSGDTLATIAQRHMNDRDQFYGLARYNSIIEPRRLEVGRVIRIPGKGPPISTSTAAGAGTAAGTAAAAAEKAAAERASAEKADAEKVAAEKAAVAAKAAAEKAAKQAEITREIERLLKLGFARKANQDPCGAARAFGDVLKLDPAHTRASLERESELSLARRAGNKC